MTVEPLASADDARSRDVADDRELVSIRGLGAVAGAFVHERHDASTREHRLTGWWGHDPGTRFAMDDNWEFTARPGADGWQLSDPPILALAPVRASGTGGSDGAAFLASTMFHQVFPDLWAITGRM